MIKNRKSLMFQIPLKIAGIVTAVMLVICIALNILLNSIISGDVKSEISYISKHNANIAQAYLENLQTTSKALAMEVNRYRSLDKESAERMLKNSLTEILKDDRIFSAYYAFEPDKFFEGTPEGLSYYAFRDGSEQMGKGNLDTKLDESKIPEDELGDLMRIFTSTSESLHGYISDISYILENIASGNLQLEVDREYEGDFQKIKDSLNNIIYSLNEVLAEMQQASGQVSLSSDQVSSASQSLAQGAAEQASSVEELSATIEDISDKVKTNAMNAGNVSRQAAEMGTEMESSNSQMQNLLEAMKAIDSKSNEISLIVKTIEDITFQTNILALNAAVEAARAGSAGKGFAVVADEVRNLAGKSAEAARNISELIESSVELIKDGSAMAVKTADSVSKVSSDSLSIVEKIDLISDSLQQESVAISQITTGMDQISAVVQTNSATAEESAAASEELFGQSQILDNLIGKFRIK